MLFYISISRAATAISQQYRWLQHGHSLLSAADGPGYYPELILFTGDLLERYDPVSAVRGRLGDAERRNCQDLYAIAYRVEAKGETVSSMQQAGM